MDHDEARTRLLEAADTLYYERGLQAVGMDELRTTAGISLKRLYQVFPSKQDLIAAHLQHRDERWRAALAEYVVAHGADPEDNLLAVFDWLRTWFCQPDFRGCAFINTFGELGTTNEQVADIARSHKKAVQSYLAELARGLPVHDPDVLAKQLFLLVDGATTTAAITNDAEAVNEARNAAKILIAAST